MKKIIIILFIISSSGILFAQDNKGNNRPSPKSIYDYFVAKVQENAKQRYSVDSNNLRLHDTLYNQAILVLDSVFRTIKDDRVDSVWNFLHSRIRPIYPHEADTLGLWDFANGRKNISDTSVIYLCPLLHEESLDGGRTSDSVYGYYSPWQRLIVFYCYSTQDFYYNFRDLAEAIYHEGYHALMRSRGIKYTKEEEKIACELSAKIFLTCSEIDAVLENSPPATWLFPGLSEKIYFKKCAKARPDYQSNLKDKFWWKNF